MKKFNDILLNSKPHANQFNKENTMPKEYGDYHGDEDTIELDRQQKEENNPRHEPNFDDKESDDE